MYIFLILFFYPNVKVSIFITQNLEKTIQQYNQETSQTHEKAPVHVYFR